MRRVLTILALVFAGCGGNGGGFDATPDPVQHVPEISSLTLSPESALYMEGDGGIEVTAEFSFTDPGRDIETLHVMISDGTSLAISVSESAGRASGTVTASFDVTTADTDGCTVEIWVVDKAGQNSNHLTAAFSVIAHAPEILNVELSPNGALHMEGGGSIVVTAEIAFLDTGLDIETLWIRMPDDTTLDFDDVTETETGSLTKDLAISTETVGAFTFEFWLVDAAGNSSEHRTAEFVVVRNAQSSDWTRRLSGLPYALNDVIWDGSVFIAVGDGGTILTSADGIDWVTQDSTIDDGLFAIAAHESDIFAVGGEIILLSTDHGESWVEKFRPEYALLSAVVVNSSQVVACGNTFDLFLPRTIISEDRGDTWEEVFYEWGYFFGFFNDLILRDGLFIAATDLLGSDGRAMASPDAAVWTEVFYDEGAGLLAIVNDGSQYVAAGGNGAVFKSFDGLNWTKTQMPVADVDYLSAAWNGSELVLAGGYSWRHYSRSDVPPFEVPVGITSTDGGVTWEIFNIDGTYESRGMAFGNGRFVSVGQSAPVSGVGAIYTAEQNRQLAQE